MISLVPIWNELFANLSEEHFSRLRNSIKSNHGINKSDFIDVIDSLFGPGIFTAESVALYNDINIMEHPYITWDVILEFFSKHSTTEKIPEFCLSSDVKIVAVDHIQRDYIQLIVLMETEKYFCYTLISRLGKVCIYDGNLEFLAKYTVIMTREDVQRNDDERRRRNRWITDAIFMPDELILVIANSTRSLTIYDVSGLHHVPVWLILGFPYVIECLAYSEFESKYKSQCLFTAYETGCVTKIIFRNQRDILPKRFLDKLNVFYWQDLKNHKKLILQSLGKLHKERIKSLKFEKQVLIACYCDPENSVVIKILTERRESYKFKMTWGAQCFAFSICLKMLITGSENGVIRVWESTRCAKPVQVMHKQRCGVIDLAIFEDIFFFVSLTRDGVIKVWNLQCFQCIQQLQLDLECFKLTSGITNFKWGIRSMHPGPRRTVYSEIFHVSEVRSDQISIEKKLNTEVSGKCVTKYNLEILKLNFRNDIIFSSGIQNQWERSNILITCGNRIYVIYLSYYDEKKRNISMPVLPPPPLQNSVLIPHDWNMFNDHGILDVNDTRNNLFASNQVLTPASRSRNINYKIANLESDKMKMTFFVEHSTPFLALRLQKIDEVQISPQLRSTDSKLQQLIVDSRQILANGEFRSSVFSSQTSNSSSSLIKSGRSSAVDFD